MEPEIPMDRHREKCKMELTVKKIFAETFEKGTKNIIVS
jgi:hypothetical protein